MRLNTGYIIADLALRRSSCLREIAAGDTVFAEGDPASSLFVVLAGRIEIVRPGPEGESRLAEVGPDGVFGEMGLIASDAVRSATARALEPTRLLEVGNDPIRTLQDMGEVGGAIQLLKHVICVLADWLRAKPAGASRGGAEGGDGAAAAVIRANLPKAWFGLSVPRARLADGEYLCRQGDRPDGFYFIHTGTLRILREGVGDAADPPAGEMRGPTVVGEVGYFSGEPRAVSLRADGEVVFSAFPAATFEELEEERPDKAIEVLVAAARSIVALVR